MRTDMTKLRYLLMQEVLNSWYLELCYMDTETYKEHIFQQYTFVYMMLNIVNACFTFIQVYPPHTHARACAQS
jgi:hypothetical protein